MGNIRRVECSYRLRPRKNERAAISNSTVVLTGATHWVTADILICLFTERGVWFRFTIFLKNKNSASIFNYFFNNSCGRGKEGRENKQSHLFSKKYHHNFAICQVIIRQIHHLRRSHIHFSPTLTQLFFKFFVKFYSRIRHFKFRFELQPIRFCEFNLNEFKN